MKMLSIFVLCISLSELLFAEGHLPFTPDLGGVDPQLSRPIDESKPKRLPESCVDAGQDKPFGTTTATDGTAVEHHYGPFARIVKNDFEKRTKTVLKEKVGAYPVMSPKGGLLIHANGSKLELMKLTPPFESRSFLSPELHKSIIENNGPVQNAPVGAFSEDEKTLVLRDNEKKAWLVIDVDSEKVLNTIPSSDDMDTVKLSKDGRRLAAFSSSGSLMTWSTSTGTKLVDKPYGSVNQPSPAAFSSDGSYGAVARAPGDSIEVFDSNGESQYTASIGKILGIEPDLIGREKKKSYDAVWAQFLSPSKYLAAGMMGKNEFVILNERGKVMGRYQAPETEKIYRPTVSSDGKSLTVDGLGKTCRITLPDLDTK